LAACDLLDSRGDFNGGGDVLMDTCICSLANTEYCLNVCGQNKSHMVKMNFISTNIEHPEIKTYIDLSKISDKDLFEEVNRRQWERMNKARLEYEAKGKPVMD
jgi:hypothetical protein